MKLNNTKEPSSFIEFLNNRDTCEEAGVYLRTLLSSSSVSTVCELIDELVEINDAKLTSWFTELYKDQFNNIDSVIRKKLFILFSQHNSLVLNNFKNYSHFMTKEEIRIHLDFLKINMPMVHKRLGVLDDI